MGFHPFLKVCKRVLESDWQQKWQRREISGVLLGDFELINLTLASI